MKSLPLLATLVACVVLPLGVQSNATKPEGPQCGSPADEEAVRGISKAWKEGYNGGHAAQVAALYSEDAYYLTQHFLTGIVHPRPLIQAYVQRGVDARYHIDSIETLKNYCSGDFAYAITRYRSTNGGVEAMGVNLVVMRKIAGKWLIVAHESAVPDPATAIRSLTPN